MITRFILTFIVCVSVYMIGMMMTTYDGILSMVFQPIVGSVISLASIIAVGVLFSPLLLPVIWDIWKRLWILPTLALLVSIALLYVSWLPQYRTEIHLDDELTVQSFNLTYSITGWFLMIFSLLWNPKIGFVGEKKWV